MIKTYPSIAALRGDYIALDAARHSDSGASDWYGNESGKETLRLSATGDTRLVPQAEALLADLDTQIETPRRTWTRGPAGAYASVPDVIAGLPTPMRYMVEEPDDRAPITILATTTSSCGIKADNLRKRGVTILALVLALSRIRPTSLYQLTAVDGKRDNTDETVILAQINTTPLDLATACYVLTSSGFSRRMTYDLAVKLNDFTGGWPRGMAYGNSGPYYKGLVDRLGFNQKTTLVIPGPQYGDELVNQPLAWVNKQVKRFTEQKAESESESLP